MKPHATDEPWPIAPRRITPADGEAHVFRLKVDEMAPDDSVLSPQEKSDAARFRSDRDRHRFIVRHAALRTLLARCLDTDPAELEFLLGPWGKPALADARLSFNMSHSSGLALVAVAQNQSVGVDVECCLREIDCVGIARRFFSAREGEMLSTVPEPERTRVFYSLWTCKEACLKAVGRGLSASPEEVRVSLDSERRPTLEEVGADGPAARRWSYTPLVPVADYVAALVVEGPGCTVRRWTFQPDSPRPAR